MSPGVKQWLAAPGRLERAVRWLVVLGCAWAAGRFWHPYYGFTRLLQFDEAAATTMLPPLRAAPLFLYPGENGYDGLYYAELAADPLARSEHLPAALDNAAYRARRILPSWVAWAAAGGDPIGALRAYAWVNLGAWLALAALLWRLLPPGDWRRTAAWAGVLLSAGALHSARLSLSDLPALLLVAAAVMAAEAGRIRRAGGWLGLAALTRETSLLGLVALASEPRRHPRRLVVATLLALAPVAAWLLYLRLRLGPADPGLGNFTWPLAGLARKCVEDLHALTAEPNTVLAVTTLLSTLGLAVQGAYVALRRDRTDSWWCLGAAYLVLLLLLGQPVWEGHPGAATRALLPLSLAFNVVVSRRRASWCWLLAGNLGVFAGVLTWVHVPQRPEEFAAGRAGGSGYVVELDSGWHGREEATGRHWAWAPREAEVRLRRSTTAPAPAAATLVLQALSPRTVSIRQGERLLWSGPLGAERQPVAVRGIEVRDGAAALRFTSDSPPGRAPGDPRDLGFALHGLRLE